MQKIPKGKLLIIGGAEDKGETATEEISRRNRKFKHFEILRELLPKKRNKKTGIEVITTASENPAEIVKMYKKAFKEAGFKKVGFINMGTNPEANNPKS
ncbi:MAG: hypothetical protein M3R27_01845 [Bacteroidota bacterium]|nr:hypothetical protein [Bacteroidota bacterium]